MTRTSCSAKVLHVVHQNNTSWDTVINRERGPVHATTAGLTGWVTSF